MFSPHQINLGTKGLLIDLCTGLLKLVSCQYIHHGTKLRCALLDTADLATFATSTARLEAIMPA